MRLDPASLAFDAAVVLACGLGGWWFAWRELRHSGESRRAAAWNALGGGMEWTLIGLAAVVTKAATPRISGLIGPGLLAQGLALALFVAAVLLARRVVMLLWRRAESGNKRPG